MESADELDPQQFPTLAGVERPFFDYWSRTILRPDDPHRDRWIEREEHAVESATQRLDLFTGHLDLDGARVLDVGCQNGAGLVALALAGARPAGIDVDELGIEAARHRTAAYGVEAQVEFASAADLPFENERFDLVMSSCVIEHVPDKTAMVDECVRVLAPGGLLYLSAPARFSVVHLTHDPHYQHRGVSVLPGGAARWWVTRVRGETEYDVETLPTQRWLRRAMRTRGLELLTLDERFAGRRVPGPAPLQLVVDELRQVAQVLARKPLEDTPFKETP